MPDDRFSHFTVEECSISASAPQTEINALLTKTGVIILKKLITQEQVDELNDDFTPLIAALGGDGSDQKWEGDFFPSTTKKLAGLLTKSDAYVRHLVMNKTLLGLADHCLTRRTKTPIGNGERKWSTAGPQLNVTACLEIHPGAEKQMLHRDDPGYHSDRPRATEWTPKRENAILSLTALNPVFPENGGTMFVPGSHLLADEEPGPSYEDCLKATLDPGDSVVILNSCYHAGGTNSMKPGEKNSIRTMCLAGYSCGFLRQEENQYLTVDPIKFAKLPLDVQELAGWKVTKPYLGWVEWEHPLAKVKRAEVAVSDALFFDVDSSVIAA